MTIFYSSSEAEIIISKSDSDNVFQSVYTVIGTKIQKFLGKGSGWIIDSIIDYTISIWKYKALAGSGYIKLPTELENPRKRLINIQNTDYNECFKWSLVRYFNPANHHPTRIIKGEKDFARKLDFKDIKFPVIIRDIHKIEKKNSTGISVFGYENKEKHPIFAWKKML